MIRSITRRTVSVGVLSLWTTLAALLGLVGLALLQRGLTRIRATYRVRYLMDSWSDTRWNPRYCPWNSCTRHRNYLPLLGILLAAGGGL